MFTRTKAIDKILALKKRKKVIQGGSSAGKTYAILAILIDKAARTPNLEISVISESIPHLKRGALKDFIKIMKNTNRWVQSRYNATDRIYRFANGSYIEFFSPEAVLGARRNILYINEANNILYENYYQLAIRTSGEIYLDYNPANEFWAHTEVLRDLDAELIVLNYLDNNALPENVIQDFNNARLKAKKEQDEGIDGYWSNWCKVYIDGEIGSLQGTIFNNWSQIDEVPDQAQLIAYGLDFGFTLDPSAFLAVYRFNDEIIVDELVYENSLTNQDLADRFKKLEINGLIIADSAEPKSIEEIRRYNFSIQPAQKGADSVRASISILQQYKIRVTERSINLIRELRSYRWLTDKSGASLNEPMDFNNHLIDALRYVALNKLTNNSNSYNFF